MRLTTQFYVRPSDVGNGTFVLTGDEARHAVKVLRHKKGDRIVASDGLGKTYMAEVLSATAKALEAKIVSLETGRNEPNINVTLAVGLTKGEKMDWLVEKATEMGAAAVWPFFARYSEVKRGEKQAEKSVERWRRIALAAFKQCGRSVIPKIELLGGLAEVINGREDAQIVTAHPIENSETALDAGKIGQKVFALIGPEGGFAPEEINAVEQAGGHFVSLGPRRLRTETAGLVLLAKLLGLKGEL